MREKKYFLKIRYEGEIMEPIDWSRIAGVLLFVIQIANVAAVYFAPVFSPDVSIAVASGIAALQAFTARIQGTGK